MAEELLLESHTDTPQVGGLDEQIGQLLDDLQTTHGEEPIAHEVILHATNELADHPVMGGTPQGVEYSPESAERYEPQLLAVMDAVEKMRESLILLSAKKDNLHEGADYEWKEVAKAEEKYQKLTQALKWDNLSSEHANLLLNTMMNIQTERTNFYQTVNFYARIYLPEVIDVVHTQLPDQVLKDLYTLQPNIGPSALRKILQFSPDTKNAALYDAEILAKVYRTDGGVDHVPEGQDLVLDKLRTHISPAELSILAIPEKPTDFSMESIAIYDEAVRSRIHDVLNEVGLDPAMVARFEFAALERLMTEAKKGEPQHFDSESVTKSLTRIKDNVEAVGPDIIEHLGNELGLGLVNIDKFSSGDLANLSKLLDNDPEFIEQLQAGDVTAVFVDSMGDYNGALSSTYHAYRKESGRTLIFEVEAASDFYRRMIFLKQRGIKPSTLVVAAHGAPNEIAFGQNSYFGLIGTSDVGTGNGYKTAVSLNQARLDRLVSDEFMQSNRGIDSSDELIGHRQIIIHSCSGDVAYEAGVVSTGESILKQINREDTIVYAAAGVESMRATEDGVSFVKTKEGKKEPNPENITRELRLEKPSSSFFDRLQRNIRGSSGDLIVKRRSIKTIPIRRKIAEASI